MTLSIDGSNAVNATTVSSQVISLTTTLSNDDIVVVVSSYQSSAQTVSSVTASGLTFTRRGSPLAWTNGGGSHVNQEVWKAPAATVFSGNITVNWSGTIDAGNVIAFGVNDDGTNISVFDSNASLPATVTNGTLSTITPSLTISTTGARSMLLAILNVTGTDAFPSLPAGFSGIQAITNTGGSATNIKTQVAQMVVGVAQTNVVVAYASAITNWGYIVDAIDGAAAPAAAATFSGFNSDPVQDVQMIAA